MAALHFILFFISEIGIMVSHGLNVNIGCALISRKCTNSQIFIILPQCLCGQIVGHKISRQICQKMSKNAFILLLKLKHHSRTTELKTNRTQTSIRAHGIKMSEIWSSDSLGPFDHMMYKVGSRVKTKNKF